MFLHHLYIQMHPYWDANRYARNLQQGFLLAWDRFLSGQAPDHITIVETEETARGTYSDFLNQHPSDRDEL